MKSKFRVKIYNILCFRSAKIAAGAVVCVESEVRGDVTIGERTYLKAFIILFFRGGAFLSF